MFTKVNLTITREDVLGEGAIGNVTPVSKVARVATEQGKQGIWFLLFPDRENTGKSINQTYSGSFKHIELMLIGMCISKNFSNISTKMSIK